MASMQPNKQDLASIKGKLDTESPSSSSAGWCICRVPPKFRESNEYAYTPEIISIGPFHCDKKDLKGMEVHKLRYMNSLLSRFGDRAAKLEECVEAISRLEDEARKCYSEPIKLNKEEFVEMMIVDSLFIVELFRKNVGEEQIDKDDPVFRNVWGLASLVRDLILLENQLPMLVLERLFNITMASQEGGKQLSELAIRFFNPLMQREERVLAKYFEIGGDHLLDMLCKTFYDLRDKQLPYGIKSVQVSEPPLSVKREEVGVERVPSSREISLVRVVRGKVKWIRDEIVSCIIRKIPLLSKVWEKIGAQRVPSDRIDPKSTVKFIYEPISILVIEGGSEGKERGMGVTTHSPRDKRIALEMRAGAHREEDPSLAPFPSTPPSTPRISRPIKKLEFQDIPSLTKLRDSGVKFKKGKNRLSFLDIKFTNGEIEIPPILIRDPNFSFVRNIIAYEQGLVGHPVQMTCYVVLMNNLIQSSNDVAFLREHRIIRNYLSDDELVSSQFQKLRDEINLANFHYPKLCIDVNAFMYLK